MPAALKILVITAICDYGDDGNAANEILVMTTIVMIFRMLQITIVHVTMVNFLPAVTTAALVLLLTLTAL